MKNGWQKTKLGDVATVQSGAGFPERYQGQIDQPIPFYKVSDMNIAGNEREMIHENNSITEGVRRELGAFLFPIGSTIFPKIGGAIATNKKRLVTRSCCVDNNVMGVIPKPGKISSEYLFFFFLAHDLSEFANEAHLPSIKKTIVEEWPIAVPPLSEQQHIVGILDDAFASIATAKANAEKNLQNARTLFESYLRTVFTKRGAGWAEKPIGEVCDLLNGFAFKSENAVPESETQLVRMGNLYGNKLDLDRSPVFYPDRFAVEQRRYILNEGDIIMSLTGTTGKEDYGYAVRIPECEHALLMNQRIAKFDSINEDLVNRDYLLHYLRSRVFLDALYPTANGTRQANLSSVTIKTLPIPLCSIREQKKIASSLESLSSETKRLESIYQQKFAALDALKKSLLHQAFSGQL